MVLRNCLGMIASVSTFGIPIGAATAFSFSNFSITVFLWCLRCILWRPLQADQNHGGFRDYARKLAAHDLDRIGIAAFVGHVDHSIIVKKNRAEKGIVRVS